MTNEQFYRSKFPKNEDFMNAAGDAFSHFCGPVGSKRCSTCQFAKSNGNNLAKCLVLWLEAEHPAPPDLPAGVKVVSDQMRKLANMKLHDDGQEFYASIGRQDLIHFADELDALLKAQEA